MEFPLRLFVDFNSLNEILTNKSDGNAANCGDSVAFSGCELLSNVDVF